MLSDNTTTVKSNTTAGEGFSIKRESAGKIISMLINMYSSPVTPIRELVMNGIEAHQLKQQATGENPGPVVIEINDDFPVSLLADVDVNASSTATVTITDYGVGMSEEEFRNIFLNIAVSSKDTSDEFVGGFGIGSKSVFMLSSTVDFTTTKNGVTTRAIISLTGNGTDSVITTTETGADSGTIVRFTIDQDKREAIVSRIGQEFTDYAEPGSIRLSVNGQEAATSEKYKALVPGQASFGGSLFQTHELDYKVDVTVIAKGEIPYHYTVENLGSYITDEMEPITREYGLLFDADNRYVADSVARRLAGLRDLVVRLDLSRDDITPSRESLIQSASLDKRIIFAIIDSMKANIQEVTDKISQARNSSEYVALLRDDAVVSQYADIIVYRIANLVRAPFNINTQKIDRLFTLDSPQVALCGEQSIDTQGFVKKVSSPFRAVFYSFEKSVKLKAYVEKYGKDCDLVNRIGGTLLKKDTPHQANINDIRSIVSFIPEFALQEVDYKQHEKDGTGVSYLGLIKSLFNVEFVDAQELRSQAMKVGGELYKAKGGPFRKGAAKPQGVKFSMAYRDNGKFALRHYANVTEIANDLEKGGELDHIITLYGIIVYSPDGRGKSQNVENALDLFNSVIHEQDEAFTLDDAEFQKLSKVFGEHDAIVVATNGAEVSDIKSSMNRRKNGRTLSYRRFGSQNIVPFVSVARNSIGNIEKLENTARDEVIKAMQVQLFLNTRSDLEELAFGKSYSNWNETIPDMALRISKEYTDRTAGWKRIQEVFGDEEYFCDLFESPQVDDKLKELSEYLESVYGAPFQETNKKDVNVFEFLNNNLGRYSLEVGDMFRNAYLNLNATGKNAVRHAGADSFHGITTSAEHREVATQVLEMIHTRVKEEREISKALRKFAS